MSQPQAARKSLLSVYNIESFLGMYLHIRLNSLTDFDFMAYPCEVILIGVEVFEASKYSLGTPLAC